MLRCKPGDLAVIVRSDFGHEGKIVRCLELIGVFKTRDRAGRICPAAWWRIDRDLHDDCPQARNEFPDDGLRPIRDPGDDAVDETIARLGAPYIEHEKADA